MPELADVEGFRRTFERWAVGKPLLHVSVPIPEILRNTTPQGLGRALHERAFETTRRHGKWLIAATDGRTLVLHFGMTGELVWSGAGHGEPSPHDAVLLEMEDGTLRYRTQRKFGGLWLARRASELAKITGPLGPDAWEIDGDAFRERLEDRRGGIKSALMDQSWLAGLGNELSDEILFRARITPDAEVSALSPSTRSALFDGMKAVLEEAMRHGRIPDEPGWLEHVRGERPGRCPRCQESLRHDPVSGRTAVWCPSCQREPD